MQVPVLEIDGKLYQQSTAIARFLAKQFNLAGKDNHEDFQIDFAYETITDLRLSKYSEHYSCLNLKLLNFVFIFFISKFI